MEDEIILRLFSNVGVPAAICFYTLYGVKGTLEKLTAAINNLSENHSKEISALKDEVKELKFKMNSWEVKHNERN